jgi:hypothetical protein
MPFWQNVSLRKKKYGAIGLGGFRTGARLANRWPRCQRTEKRNLAICFCFMAAEVVCGPKEKSKGAVQLFAVFFLIQGTLLFIYVFLFFLVFSHWTTNFLTDAYYPLHNQLLDETITTSRSSLSSELNFNKTSCIL